MPPPQTDRPAPPAGVPRRRREWPGGRTWSAPGAPQGGTGYQERAGRMGGWRWSRPTSAHQQIWGPQRVDDLV